MRSFSNFLLYFLALGVAGYTVVAYGLLPLGSLVHPDMRVNFLTHSLGIYTHAFASTVAMALGPFQFSTKLRQRNPKLHRWLGRVYLAVGVLIGGLSGLYMAQFAYGGLAAKVGFATLAVLWLYTGLRAYVAIRSGDVTGHRKWMLRNFALTFAAVMLRVYLPLSMAARLDFASSYAAIAWLCWVPNLLFAEWWQRRREMARAK